MPFLNVSDNYLNAPLQPDVLVSLCQDPAMADAALMTSSMAGATGFTVPPDSAMGVSARTMQPLYAAESVDSQLQMASQLLPKDLLEASINNTTFGQGYVTVYKQERPPQGIALLREQIKLPVANQSLCAAPDAPCFFMPTFGAYGVHNFDNGGVGDDPRYSPPVYDSAAGTYKMPGMINNGPLLVGATGSAPSATAMVAS
jgi:hypothetical protein